jgi:hypothetical protein
MFCCKSGLSTRAVSMCDVLSCRRSSSHHSNLLQHAQTQATVLHTIKSTVVYNISTANRVFSPLSGHTSARLWGSGSRCPAQTAPARAINTQVEGTQPAMTCRYVACCAANRKGTRHKLYAMAEAGVRTAAAQHSQDAQIATIRLWSSAHFRHVRTKTSQLRHLITHKTSRPNSCGRAVAYLWRGQGQRAGVHSPLPEYLGQAVQLPHARGPIVCMRTTAAGAALD